MTPALEVRALTRKFGSKVAVNALDLTVPAGCFYGFLGPNGAGKSTTLKCVTGLLEPTSGSISILGFDAAKEPVEIKRRIGVVPEDLALFDRLSGTETLSFVGRVHGLKRTDIESRTLELLRVMDLESDANGLVADYSHGMRKKLSLAAALIPAPRLLFLDEPFEGIDAVASRQIRTLLQSFVERGGTIFLTSHILTIVETLCDRIGVIDKGRMVAEGPIEELRAGNVAGRSLEEIFLDLIGAGEGEAPVLNWLAR